MSTATNRTTPARTARSQVQIDEGLTSEQLAVRSEEPVRYLSTDTQAEHEAAVLAEAETILLRRWTRQGILSSPRETEAWLRMRCSTMTAEAFGVILLDNKHRILGHHELFRGTLDGCSVYPREVVRECLLANAAAVILYHNHPSGNPEPSAADRAITQTLKQALDLIGCRVIDHLIAGEAVVSLAMRGLC